MILSVFFDTLKEKHVQFEVHFGFPILYLIISDELFENKDTSERLDILSRKIGVSSIEINSTLSRGSVREFLVAPSESSKYQFLRARNSANHWIPLLTSNGPNPNIPDPGLPRSIHFYGFKGGQGRSTGLGMFAKALAEDGYRVLVVDADLEAPTLDAMFGLNSIPLEATLMGLAGWTDTFKPMQVPTAPGIYFVGSRPSNSVYDLDFLNFTLNSSINPNLLSDAIEKLKNFIKNTSSTLSKFDFVIFDHRTGVSNSIIPTINAWPGSVVFCARLDSQSKWISIVNSLFQFNSEIPGAFFCFGNDIESKNQILTDDQRKLKSDLLACLAKALRKFADPETDELSDEELERYFINWRFDRAFINAQSLPDVENLQTDNANSLKELREVLGITKNILKMPEIPEKVGDRSPSGAKDNAWFVESPSLKVLFTQDSNIRYVFGRKGTGKTRLFREMLSRKLGKSLLAPGDFNEEVHSSDRHVESLLKAVNGNFETFWWVLVAARIRGLKSTEDYRKEIELWLSLKDQEKKDYCNPLTISKLAEDLNPTWLFIDGVETTVGAKDIQQFVESMMRCVAVIQSDEKLSKNVSIRVFLRLDLILGIQNVEQTTADCRIDLQWDEKAQMNYLVASLASQPWIVERFGNVVSEIKAVQQEIQSATLSPDKCEELLNKVFPQKIRTSNLLTITFLKTYFCDAASEVSARKSTFYPRLFFVFVQKIESIAKSKESDGQSAMDENNHIGHRILYDAYNAAATEFRNDILQELRHAISFDDTPAKNFDLVDRFINSLEGRSTPFLIDDFVRSLAEEFAGDSINSSSIQNAFTRMLNMGMFEKEKGNQRKWRAGRVYKYALGMKYVRA